MARHTFEVALRSLKASTSSFTIS